MNTVAGNYLLVNEAEGAEMKVDFLHVKKAALTLRAMNHKLRQQIMKLLEENDKLTVTEIYVVKTERDGKFIYYRLNEPRIVEISRCVEDIIS